MNRVFVVTGGSGFIGSNFVVRLLESQPDVFVVNLDKLTYAANPDNLAPIQNNPNYHFIHGDICDRDLVSHIFDKFNPEGIFHFAAETHVDNSISDPGVFIKTNVEGTFILLDTARRFWMSAPGECRQEYLNCRFLYVSTDEVYGSLGDNGLFTETTPFAPNSPYSVSKASADMLVRSYCKTFGMNTVVTNCSNNYGPRQHIENFIPLIIDRVLSHQPIPVYGDGRNIRDWLFVDDHCDAILRVFERGTKGESYNIGGGNEKENLWIVNTICDLVQDFRPLQSNRLKSYRDLVTFVKDRPGHDRRYAIDASKIETNLGWRAKENLQSGLEKTVAWYIEQWDARRFPGKVYD